jgi:hypothetical protein
MKIKTIQKNNDWAKPKKGRKRKSSLELGVKHTARIEATRTVKDIVGNGLLGDILALLVRKQIK